MEYTITFCLVLLNLCYAAPLSKPIASTSILFWSLTSEVAAVTEEISWQLPFSRGTFGLQQLEGGGCTSQGREEEVY